MGSPQQQKTITPGPEVLLFYVQGLYAEFARDFLRSWLASVSTDKQLYQITNPPNNAAFDAKGMYVIWYEDYEAGQHDPVYVGITGRKFSTRFQEHINSGKIKDNWIKNENVFASVMPMDLPTAKFLESTLLAAFDFALNKEENDEVRYNLGIGEVSVKDAQAHFAGILHNGITYLQSLEGIKVGNVGHKDVIN